MNLKEELERIQKLANDIWFFTDRILTHPDFIKQSPLGTKTPIIELGLSNRALRCLRCNSIEYVEQLTNLTDKELLRIRNIGKRTVTEIREKTIVH